jgi:acetyl-CoA carboxylase carboxyltransferase component
MSGDPSDGGDETERPELAELRARKRLLADEARPEAVAKRHRSGLRTARENLADLIDEGSFVEYGGLAIAAQRARREQQELFERTPADGLIAGTARINGEQFGDAAACAVLSYDYMVLAGTQGVQGHRKKDRIFELIERLRLPTVLFAEGGGGRPGDTDYPVVSALDTRAFALWARISGLAPRIAIVAGRCFAGNAVLAGSADLIVATESIALGMGGPAMVAGGGLGDFAPEQIGPIDVQSPNGVVDVRVAGETEAVAATKRLLSYFQGSVADWVAPDPRGLRKVIPESRRRAYDVHRAIDALVDEGSATYLRDEFAKGMVTALARIEGRAVGIVANNPMQMAGAITSEGSDKAARFMQLCDAYGIPLLAMIDTPGMMVGPDAEATALVRHCSRLFNTGANLRVPLIALILRKAYGLGAQAMDGGGLHEPLLTIGWPTAELGAMGLEGAVRLGLKRELDAIDDPDEREQRVREMTAHAHEHAKALNAATLFELDDVIDPADSRRLISATLAAAGRERAEPGGRESHRPVDTW